MDLITLPVLLLVPLVETDRLWGHDILEHCGTNFATAVDTALALEKVTMIQPSTRLSGGSS